MFYDVISITYHVKNAQRVDKDDPRNVKPMHITAREIGIPDWVINLRHRLAHGPGEQNMNGLHEALKIVLKALIYNEKNYWNDQYILYQEEIEFSNRRKHIYSFVALSIRSKARI